MNQIFKLIALILIRSFVNHIGQIEELFTTINDDGELDIAYYILGGIDAPDEDTTYVASLRSIYNATICGGTILNSRWVLTAAHCTKGLSLHHFKVVVGSNDLLSGGDSYSMESIINHENYTDVYNGYDISLIKVSSDIVFGNRVQPIPLPKEDTGAGVSLIATGWGRTSINGVKSSYLQMVILKSLSNQQCQEKFHDTKSKSTIIESQICTLTKPGEGTCQGDSGSPLVEDDSVVGVVSWGEPCAVGVPDVFTRVYAFKDWIKEKIDH